MSRRLLLAAWIGLLLTPASAISQSVCGNAGRYHLRPAPTVLVAPLPTPADLDAGEIDAGVMTVTIIPRGNTSKNWELCLRTTSPSMGGGTKPSADLEFWPPGGAEWQPASTLEQVVARGRGRSDVELRFRVRVDWTDDPGSYSSVVALTVAAH
jgi:hypothetical protein